MVVNDLNLLWTRIGPHEPDPPLVIDPDTVLPCSITFELLQAIPRRKPQIIENFCGADLPKLTQRLPLDARIDGRDALTTSQTLGVFTPERSDHATSM